MSRPGLIFPDTNDCPYVIAEAVWDIRNRQDGPHTHKLIRERYFTENFFMLAVQYVFDSNEWTFTTDEKRKFRKIYRGTP